MTDDMNARLAPAFERLRAGDSAGARAACVAILADDPDLPSAQALLGLLLCQAGQPADAVEHLRSALHHWPDDLATRVNLATALASLGRLEEALTVATASAISDVRLQRIAGYAHQQHGNFDAARSAYEDVVTAMPRDVESWNNLGNVNASLEDYDGAILAFQTAMALRPDLAILPINLGKALATADRDVERQALLAAAALRLPNHAELQMELGLAEAALKDQPAAERAFRAAIQMTDGFTPAYLELGLLLENLNRIDDLAALVTEAEQRGVAAVELNFIKAWLHRRQGQLAEALAQAEAVPDTIAPLRRAQLIAELADRLGDSDRAFAAFEEMNRHSLAEAGPMAGPSYGEEVATAAAAVTKETIAQWRPIHVNPVPAPPIIILGFPRSGTTLLDTLLMNLPSLHVMEELPVMRQLEIKLGGPADLATMSSDDANGLRSLYFEALDRISPPPRDGMTIVDKFPLHLARMPLIHRVFPDAKVVLVERHPCDAVLSCFMSNFTLNKAMRHFTTLEGAARLYDTVFDAWTRATDLLPINVHRIRYERMVDDLEGEMRSLLGFLDIPWNPQVLDNQGSAAKRTHISTASYSQVTEPIYRRASGRWERYRAQMAPVLPILAPWAERMGYPL
ncbi:tetratricopeptide repeat-containing sulfotransferase family protein [Sphingomonas sp. GC_Shp_5]|uniref:tetratricopeptide repeat-containing sulfotransferase family protein n=2 Tax=Sphingomonas TaxID=13687 RepID=UPI00226A022D|nr:tetratricopeptide repeat-containing sulfotransferase family protein [Sphingomonas sp. GC_Shp_5]